MGSVCLWAVLLALAELDKSISAAASKWPSQRVCSAARRLLVPGVIVGASVPLSRPALLAEAGWEGTCVDLFLCPLHHRDLCGLPSAPLRLPSVLWGLCPRVSVPEACPLCRGECVPLLHLPGLPTSSQGHELLFLLPGPALWATRLVCMPEFVCFPSQGTRARPLGCKACVCSRGLDAATLGSPGPPSAPHRLCALERCVCSSALGSPSHSWGHSS